MAQCKEHAGHAHQHGENCGHVAIKHEGHIDYLHDGHLHHHHGDHCDEHRLAVSETNPNVCRQIEGETHVHGPGCGHESVPHGDHVDYLVEGRLHHKHDGHCDDHGPVEIVRQA